MVSQYIKNQWIKAGIPNAENLIVDEPTPQDPTVNLAPDGTGGPATLPGGGEDDEQGPEDLESSPDGPSNLPGIPGLGGSGAGGGLGTGISAGPTAGAGAGLDPSSGSGPIGGGVTNVTYGGGLAGSGASGGGLAGGGGGGGRGGGSGSFTTGQGGLPPSGYDFGPGGDVGGPGQGGGTPPQGAIGGFGDLGRDRRERQEYLEDLKNYRTLDLPDEAVSGVDRLVESYNQAYSEARGANEARYQQLLGITDQTTGQRAADIRSDASEERSDLQQGLARTGLSNTTVSPTLTAGVRRREQESLNRLADQMQGTKLGIIERREDQYPDSASLQASLSGLSEGYGGKGVSALYNALGNVQQGGGGGGVTPAAGVYGAPTSQSAAAGAAGLPLNESGLAPALPSIPTFGKQKGGDVFRTL